MIAGGGRWSVAGDWWYETLGSENRSGLGLTGVTSAHIDYASVRMCLARVVRHRRGVAADPRRSAALEPVWAGSEWVKFRSGFEAVDDGQYEARRLRGIIGVDVETLRGST
jgi:hypothetical protein